MYCNCYYLQRNFQRFFGLGDAAFGLLSDIFIPIAQAIKFESLNSAPESSIGLLELWRD